MPRLLLDQKCIRKSGRILRKVVQLKVLTLPTAGRSSYGVFIQIPSSAFPARPCLPFLSDLACDISARARSKINTHMKTAPVLCSVVPCNGEALVVLIATGVYCRDGLFAPVTCLQPTKRDQRMWLSFITQTKSCVCAYPAKDAVLLPSPFSCKYVRVRLSLSCNVEVSPGLSKLYWLCHRVALAIGEQIQCSLCLRWSPPVLKSLMAGVW